MIGRFVFLTVCVVALCGCPPERKNSPQSAAVVPLKCELNIQMIGRNITFKGIEIKEFKLAEFAYDEKAVQTATALLMQYDVAQKSMCQLAVSKDPSDPKRGEYEERMAKLAEGSVAAAGELAKAQNPAQAQAAIASTEASLNKNAATPAGSK